MTNTISADDLFALEARLEHDGFSEHDFTIVKLVSHARSLNAPTELVDAVANTALPEMTRRCALCQLAELWPEAEQNNGFSDLLTAWREHQDLRKSGASIAELFRSRLRLEAARRQNQLRPS